MRRELWNGLAIAVVMALFGWTILAAGTSLERLGDRIQIALPVAAGVCSATKGALAETAGRFVGSMVVVHGFKRGLGDAEVNRRPNGGSLGFPSGHTAAAVFGASYLVRECAGLLPYAGPAAVMAAGFVGGSRIDAGKHDLVQVMAGSLIGLFFDLGFRCVATRRWLVRAWGRMGGAVRARARPVRALMILAAMVAMAPEWVRAEQVLSLYGGAQGAFSSDVTGDDDAGSFSDFEAGWEGRSFEGMPYYGARYSYWSADDWGVTVDFTHSKLYADEVTLARSGFDRLEFTDGLNVITLGVQRRFAPVRGLRPYAGIGLGIAWPHVETTSPGADEPTFEYQYGGPAVEIRAGASYDLSPRWAVFAEYEGNFVRLDVDMRTDGGLATDVFTNALNFGASFSFGRD